MKNNRNLFMTGGSRGIGKQLVLEYVSKGYDVYVCARNENDLKLLKEKVKSLGQICYYSICDVRDSDAAFQAVSDAVLKMGSIDRAYLSAGIDLFDSVIGLNIDTVKKVMDINFFGMINYLKPLIDYSVKSGNSCKIGVISSLGDVRGIPGSTAYCASKAAVSKILESARIELKGTPVEVITIRPGFVKTEMTLKNDFKMPFLLSPEKAAEIIYRKVEKGRTRISFPFGAYMAAVIMLNMSSTMYESCMRYRFLQQQKK